MVPLSQALGPNEFNSSDRTLRLNIRSPGLGGCLGSERELDKRPCGVGGTYNYRGPRLLARHSKFDLPLANYSTGRVCCFRYNLILATFLA